MSFSTKLKLLQVFMRIELKYSVARWRYLGPGTWVQIDAFSKSLGLGAKKKTVERETSDTPNKTFKCIYVYASSYIGKEGRDTDSWHWYRPVSKSSGLFFPFYILRRYSKGHRHRPADAPPFFSSSTMTLSLIMFFWKSCLMIFSWWRERNVCEFNQRV